MSFYEQKKELQLLGWLYFSYSWGPLRFQHKATLLEPYQMKAFIEMKNILNVEKFDYGFIGRTCYKIKTMFNDGKIEN